MSIRREWGSAAACADFFRTTGLVLAAAVLCALACGGGTDADQTGGDGGNEISSGIIEPFPELVCPGNAACRTSAGLLRVGAGRASITPDLSRYETEWTDVNNDNHRVTLVHWSAHPEYFWSKNNLITADYIYWIRDIVENGAPANPVCGLPAVDGLGGEVVYVNGPIGSRPRTTTFSTRAIPILIGPKAIPMKRPIRSGPGSKRKLSARW